MMINILDKRNLSYQEIDRVEIEVGPVDYTCNRPAPKDTEDARFSFQHIMAALMLDGDIGSHHFSEETLTDTRFNEARKKISVINHPDWPPEFMSGVSKIRVIQKNGKAEAEEMKQHRSYI